MVKIIFDFKGNAILYFGHCLQWELSEKVTTFISGRNKACDLACYNSDQNVGKSSGKSSEVALPANDIQLFSYWIPRFFGEGLWYSNLGIFWYQLFSFYLLLLREFQCVPKLSRFIYLMYTRLISTDSDKELISVFSSGDCTLILAALNT